MLSDNIGNNLINVINDKDKDNNQVLENIKSIFDAKKIYNPSEKYTINKNLIDSLNTWFNNDGKLIGSDTSFNLYIKNKNIGLNINLKECKNDIIFNKLVFNYPK